MSETKSNRVQRIVSGLTGVLLVFQALLPLVQPGVIRPALADPVAGSWTFTTALDYTATGAVTIGNTGGYAVTDLTWTAASDNLDSSAGTQDLIQIPTGASAGRILAAVSEDVTPRSDDFGDTWSYNGVACGLNSADTITDLGTAGGNMLAGGIQASGAYIGRSVDGDCWTDSGFTGLNATDVAVTDFSSNRLGTVYASTWDTVAGQVLASVDSGVNWTATAANPGPAILQTVEVAGGRIYAAGIDIVGDAESGIYYSDNAGASWTEAATTTGGNTHSIIKDLYFYSGSKRLFAVTNAGYILQSSGDASIGVPTFTKTSATNAGLATDIMVTNLGGGVDIFITLSNGGIMRSVDGGTNYFTSTTALPAGSGNRIIRIDTDSSGSPDDTYLVAQVNGGAGNAYIGTFATSQTVTVNTGTAYASLSGFTETMSAASETSGINYQISNDGDTWYYNNGLAWAEASNITTDVNGATAIDSRIGTFDDDHTGSFYFKAIMSVAAGETEASAVNSSIILDSVSITYAAATVTLEDPNGGEEWPQTSTQQINWSSDGLAGGNLITLSYSYDGGGWNIIDDTENNPTANDGSYLWTVPNIISDDVLVKVAASDIEDQSDNPFSITEIDTGGGGCTDSEVPTSTVVALDEYEADVPFRVTATATDDCSGVAGVNLYYTYGNPAGEQTDLIPFGDQHSGCPVDCFEWDFNAPYGDGRYYFYTSAIDNDGNSNFESKFDGLDLGQGEAATTVDTAGPSVEYSSPDLDETDIGVDGEFNIRFDEFVNPDTLEYGLFLIQPGGNKVDATDKLGTLEWQPTFYQPYCPPKYVCPPSEFRYDEEFILPYEGLENGTDYYFVIRNLQDYAGNDLVTNYLEMPEDELVWALHFETVEVINPDMTQSTIEITNLPQSGKFNPGDKVSFKVTLKNVSDTPSLTTLTLPIVTGLTYCDDGPCEPAASSSGQAPVIITDGDEVSVVWTGTVIAGTNVLVTFDALVASPVQDLTLTQTAEIDDGLHDEIYVKSVDVEINEVANFSTSTKTGTCFWMGSVRPCTDAVVGTEVTYTITITNTGTTPATRTITDALGNYLSYVSGPTGSGWASLSYDVTANAIVGTATFAPGTSKSFVFSATFTQAAAGLSVTNTADIGSWSPDPRYTTLVPGISEPEQFPPIIVLQSPADDATGVAESTPIVVAFSKSIDRTTFDYTLTANGTPVNTENFEIAWDSHNGNSNAKATITHPNFGVATQYILTVSSGVTDLDGNTLQGGSLPNPWNWMIIDPVVVISSPPDQVVVVGVNQVSPQFIVSIVDQGTGQPYMVPERTNIGLLAEVPGTGEPGQKRQVSTTARFATRIDANFRPSTEDLIFDISIAPGTNQAHFYYKDSAKGVVTLIAFPEPWNGWSAGDKSVLVTDELETHEARLVADISDTKMAVGQFSQPITVRAESTDASPLLLPSRLYFYTESTTGAFYDSNRVRLPDYITVQANPTTQLQYANTGGLSSTFYYMDSVPQSSLVIISDNAPLSPDTAMGNAAAIMTVSGEVTPELFLDLVPVVDDTGRVLATVEIDPTQIVILPGGIRSFAVRALDTAGQVIENAEFKWYVVAGGGTIEKDGVNDTSHESVFTAGEELGSYYDTIVVATIYNGGFGFASASVRVSDIVEYGGPGQLPFTGISGIQVIFTILTLMSAIALAWVEHYDKTHFSKES